MYVLIIEDVFRYVSVAPDSLWCLSLDLGVRMDQPAQNVVFG
jgi:hypothetical protein